MLKQFIPPAIKMRSTQFNTSNVDNLIGDISANINNFSGAFSNLNIISSNITTLTGTNIFTTNFSAVNITGSNIIFTTGNFTDLIIVNELATSITGGQISVTGLNVFNLTGINVQYINETGT